jgi:hypothetical protein
MVFVDDLYIDSWFVTHECCALGLHLDIGYTGISGNGQKAHLSAVDFPGIYDGVIGHF